MRIMRLDMSMRDWVSVKSPMSTGPARRMQTTSTTAVPTASFRPDFAPSTTRSMRPAPMFCPVKVVMALPKEKLGIMTKPSTRMTMVLQATKTAPKELVRDWTTRAEQLITAWDSPEGRPSRTSCMA